MEMWPPALRPSLGVRHRRSMEKGQGSTEKGQGRSRAVGISPARQNPRSCMVATPRAVKRTAHTPGTSVLTIGGWPSSAAAGIKPPALGEAQPAPSAPAPRPTACSQTAQPWWRRSVPPWPSTPGRAARRLPIRMAPRTCPGGGSTSHCGPPTSPRLPEQGVTWRQMRPLTPSASNTSATPPHGARERCAYGGPSRCLHQGLTRPSYCPPWCRCPPAPRGFMPVNGFGAADCLGDQLDRSSEKGSD